MLSGTFEYQRLHGMGEELYSQVIAPEQGGHACRVYAPVGPHEDLLPYLVRRLLENGANTSFVNRIVDARLPAEAVVTGSGGAGGWLHGDPTPRASLSRLASTAPSASTRPA